MSRYAFWIAIACLIIAAVNLFSDTALIHYLIELFSISEIMRVVFPALIAGMFYFGALNANAKKYYGITVLSLFSFRDIIYGGFSLATR